MSFVYHAAFDVAALNPGTLTLATAGKPNVVITLGNLRGTDADGNSSSLFFHFSFGFTLTWFTRGMDPGGTTRLPEYSKSPFFLALQNKLIAEATTQGWTAPTGIVVDQTAGKYTITYPSANITLTFSSYSTGGALLGFTGSHSGSTSASSDVVALYEIVPTLSAVSLPTLNYEPSGIGNRVLSDDGSGFGISRTVSPLYRDWVQQFETKAKTDRASALAAHPFTFQALFEHCRGEFPFVVDGGGFDAGSTPIVFSLRTEGLHWAAEGMRATRASDKYFHIPFKCIVEGVPTIG